MKKWQNISFSCHTHQNMKTKTNTNRMPLDRTLSFPLSLSLRTHTYLIHTNYFIPHFVNPMIWDLFLSILLKSRCFQTLQLPWLHCYLRYLPIAIQTSTHCYIFCFPCVFNLLIYFFFLITSHHIKQKQNPQKQKEIGLK